MTKRLLLPALLATAALSLPAQEPAAPASLPITPSATLPALPPLNQLLQGASAAGMMSHEDAPPLSQEELMKQIDTLGSSGPITRMPKIQTPKNGEDKNGTGNGTTEITAREGSFDQKAHLAIFLKDVFVENPDFTVNCEKLTAFLHHDEKDASGAKADPKAPPAKPGVKGAATPKPVVKAAATPASTKAPKASIATSGNATQEDREGVLGPPPKPAGGGGLEKAIAEGSVVINQDKIDPDGTIQHNIGHSKKAVYEAATGNITLTGMPSVDQGLNTCVALAEDTVIVLNRAGEMKVFGLHKSVIRDSGSSDPKTANAR